MRGLLAQLSPHEENTLRLIAQGEGSSFALNAAHLARLKKLALIEEIHGGSVRLTPLGTQRHANLDRPEKWISDVVPMPRFPPSTH